MSFFSSQPKTDKKLCNQCKKEGTIQCTKCKKVFYCSNTCLESDKGLHLHFCNPMGKLTIDYKNLFNKERNLIIFSTKDYEQKEMLYNLFIANEQRIINILTVFYQREVSSFFLTNQVFLNMLNNLYDHFANLSLLIYMYKKTKETQMAMDLFLLVTKKYDQYFDLIINDLKKKLKNAKNSTILFKAATTSSIIMLKLLSNLIVISKQLNKIAIQKVLLVKYFTLSEGISNSFNKKQFYYEKINTLSLLSYFVLHSYYHFSIPLQIYNHIITTKTQFHNYDKIFFCELYAHYNMSVLNYVQGDNSSALTLVLQIEKANEFKEATGLLYANKIKRYLTIVKKLLVEVLYNGKRYLEALNLLKSKENEESEEADIEKIDAPFFDFFISKIAQKLPINEEMPIISLRRSRYLQLSKNHQKTMYVNIVDTLQEDNGNYSIIDRQSPLNSQIDRNKDKSIQPHSLSMQESTKELHKLFLFLTSLSVYQFKLLNESQPNFGDKKMKNNLPIYFSNQFTDSLSYNQRMKLYNLNSLSLNRFAILCDPDKEISLDNFNYTFLKLKERTLISNPSTRRSSSINQLSDNRKTDEMENNQKFKEFSNELLTLSEDENEKFLIKTNLKAIYNIFKGLDENDIEEIKKYPEVLFNLLREYVINKEYIKKKKEEDFFSKNREYITRIKKAAQSRPFCFHRKYTIEEEEELNVDNEDNENESTTNGNDTNRKNLPDNDKENDTEYSIEVDTS